MLKRVVLPLVSRGHGLEVISAKEVPLRPRTRARVASSGAVGLGFLVNQLIGMSEERSEKRLTIK